MMSFYLDHQVKVLTPFLKGTERVLDFGCGDMSLDIALKKRFSRLVLTAVDVVQPKFLPRGIRFILYDGERLPFRDKTFDFVFAYHVLHHTQDPFFSLSEVVRVAKRGVIIVEPVVRAFWDIPGLRILDFLSNIFRKEQIPMPYHFHTRQEWYTYFQKLGMRVEEEKSVGFFPNWLPIGQTILFSLYRT